VKVVFCGDDKLDQKLPLLDSHTWNPEVLFQQSWLLFVQFLRTIKRGILPSTFYLWKVIQLPRTLFMKTINIFHS